MRFVSFCPPLNRLGIECVSNSANLYIVIITPSRNRPKPLDWPSGMSVASCASPIWRRRF